MKPEIFWGGHSKEEIPILKIINDFPCFYIYMLHFGGLREVSIMPHIISISYDSVLHFGGLREVSIMLTFISVSYKYDTVLFRLPRMARIWKKSSIWNCCVNVIRYTSPKRWIQENLVTFIQAFSTPLKRTNNSSQIEFTIKKQVYGTVPMYWFIYYGPLLI